MLRLDDDELRRLGVTFKLHRRAMVESLDRLRAECAPPGGVVEEKSSVQGSFRKAWDRVSAHQDLDNDRQHAWERVSGLAVVTDEDGVATFDVEELGHAYDMMRIEQVYQLLAKKRGDEWTILDEAEADAIRPRIAEIIDDHDGDLADEIKVDS